MGDEKSANVLIADPSLRQLNLVSNGRGLSSAAAYTVPSRDPSQHQVNYALLHEARSYGFGDADAQAFDVVSPIEGKAFRRNVKLQTFSKRVTSTLSWFPATEVLEVIFDESDILSSTTTASK